MVAERIGIERRGFAPDQLGRDLQQVGRRVSWTVDPDGFLIVVAGRVPLTERAAARVEVTVTTYGLDDAAFENRREEWTKRWAPMAADAIVTAAPDPSPETR